MATLLTIPSNRGKHTVRIEKTNDRIDLYIYLNKDKRPYCGTNFSLNDSINDMINWAKNKVNEYPKSIII